jgi:transcriptional regulator with XRE-family HTH domain
MERNEFDKLGAILKAARITRGFTRERLAEIIGISPRYLMSIENEDKKPSYDVLFHLIRELGISADKIFYPETENNDTEIDQLINLFRLCDEHTLKTTITIIKALLDNK